MLVSRAPALQLPGDQRRLDQPPARRSECRWPREIRHRRAPVSSASSARAQRDASRERWSLPGRAFDRDRAAHALDDPLGNRQPKAGAAELAGRAAVGLLEFAGNRAPGPRGEMPMPVSRTGDGNRVGLRGRLDDDGDAAVIGELDGVAGEVEQHLAQARGVADDARGQALVDVAADLETFRLRARAEQLDGFLDKGRERKTAARRDRAGRLRSWRNRAPPRSAKATSRPRSSRPSGRSSAPASAPCRREDRPCRECRSAGCGSRAKPSSGSATWRGWPLRPGRARPRARARISTRSVTSRPTLCISLARRRRARSPRARRSSGRHRSPLFSDHRRACRPP